MPAPATVTRAPPPPTNRTSAAFVQQLSLFLSVWRTAHHVCENYPSANPNGTAATAPNECTGNHLYTWGGLAVFMGLAEAGVA